MSKRIVEAVDKLTEGAIVGDDKTLEERRKQRARLKAERKAAEEAAKREEMKGKFMPAFARNDTGGDEGGPDEEGAVEEKKPRHESKAAESQPSKTKESKRMGRPPVKHKRVQESVTLPKPLWEAIQKYIYLSAIEGGVTFKNKSEVFEAEILKNEDIKRIYEDLTRD